jgi:predicted component of type VI protein secretion system
MATKELALALVARALDAGGEPGGPRVTVIEGPDAGKVLALTEPSRAYIIGRGEDADLCLTDTDASRRHVKLVRRADHVLARDAGSKNGAAVEGETLSRDSDRVVRPGETLRIGQSLLSYEHPAIGALQELEHAADERMHEGEAVPGPERDPGAPLPAPAPGAAPIAELPTNKARSQGRAAPSGWSSTDFMVVLLAIGVLALSILGMFWLFKG